MKYSSVGEGGRLKSCVNSALIKVGARGENKRLSNYAKTLGQSFEEETRMRGREGGVSRSEHNLVGGGGN
jgi:hypothetical protein